MTIVNQLTTGLFDLIFAILRFGPDWLSLVIVAGVLAFLGLLTYRFTSNQNAIRRIKARNKAELLAIKLFRDDPGVIFGALASIVFGSLNMLRYALPPLAIMIVPFVLIVAQLALRYQWRSVHTNETVLVTVQFVHECDLLAPPPTLSFTEGLSADAAPVRIPSESKMVWRVRATEPGQRQCFVHVADESAAKEIVVGNSLQRVCPKRVRSGIWDRVLYPAESPIESAARIESITVAYPPRESWFIGANAWIVWLIAISYLWALLLKRWMRVEF